MKLIIDIPEDVYKRTKFYKEFRDLNDCVTTIKALENGTPLDEVITDRVEYGADGNAYRLTISNGKALEQEPCEDAISRQAVDTLVDELARAISDERCCISRGRSTATIMQDILDLPSVTQEPKTGHWTHPRVIAMPYEYADMCSCCREWGKVLTFNANYCPNCGARMNGKENEQ